MDQESRDFYLNLMGKKKQGRGRAKSRNRRTVLTKIVVDTPKGSGVFPTFADAFLPIDYPNSVESGYLPYQIWFKYRAVCLFSVFLTGRVLVQFI